MQVLHVIVEYLQEANPTNVSEVGKQEGSQKMQKVYCLHLCFLGQ